MRAVAAAAAAALLGLIGCAEIGLVPNGVPAPPAARPVLRPERAPSATFGAALIAHRMVDGLRLEVFVVGEGHVRGNLVSEEKSPEAHLKPPVLAFLVTHPKEGAILFGAGLPEDLGGLGAARVKGAALSPFKVAPNRDIVSQLAAQGVRAEDVKWVILPDLAPEWAGRAGAFPNATVVMSAQAWKDPRRRALEADLPDPRAFVPEERLKLVDLSVEKPFGPFDHGKDLFGDGTVILVDLAGGATGGMGLWLNLDSGPVLLTGPAAYVYDNVFDDALPDRRFVVDVSSFAWNTRAMRLAVEAVPRLVVVPAHDLSTLKLSPRPDITIAP
ncbi:MAG: MBL fold metallo-hydrolase [Elusimicrobia bacterium]|nr:MBL fold metallo-hydrolase [Elusimicrobiota bacterium]